MAVSGKTAGPYEIPYSLSTDHPPDMAAVSKAMAERTHAELAAVAAAPLGSSQIKPTTGLKQASGGSLTLTTAYQDIAGTTLEITPTVASILRIWATFDLQAQILEGVHQCDIYGITNLDGADQTSQYAHMLLLGPDTAGGSHSMVTQLALSAAKHTIKLRARYVLGGGAVGAFVVPAGTHYTYDLVAS